MIIILGSYQLYTNLPNNFFLLTNNETTLFVNPVQCINPSKRLPPRLWESYITELQDWIQHLLKYHSLNPKAKSLLYYLNQEPML